MVRMIAVALVCAGALAAAAAEESQIKYAPLSIAGLSELGQLKGARYGANQPIESDWVDHFGVFITQTALIDDRTAFDIGLGGIFQFMKREEVLSRWLGTQWKAFFIGPTVADIRHGATVDGEGFGLQFGRFTYKYNPDATNLGEYLFRSGAYPTFLLGGGYAIVSAPQAFLQGLRLNYRAGALNADLLVVTETTVPALYDFSVAGLVNYKVADGLLDLGAGVNLKRIIPVRPSKTSPEVVQNSYFTRGGVDYTGYPAYYQEQANFYKEMAKRDSLNAASWNAKAATVESTAVNVGAWLADPAAAGITPEYYTQKAIMAMFRAAVDFKKLFGGEALGPDDLRLSVEANILGIKNYPIFYEKFTDRMPVTVSFNLPAFRVLDLFSVQVEHFGSPWMNGYGNLLGSNNKNVPVPTMPAGGDPIWNETEFNDVSKRDNLSWSVLLKKNISGGAWASAQFARDHSRTVSKDFWTGGGLEPTEVLGTEKDWYWMLQLGFGI